jgi:hypothetical protein
VSRAGTGVAAVSGFPAVPSRPVTSVQARARARRVKVTSMSWLSRRGRDNGRAAFGEPVHEDRDEAGRSAWDLLGQYRGDLRALSHPADRQAAGRCLPGSSPAARSTSRRLGRPMSSPWRIVTRGGMSTSTTELPEQDFTAQKETTRPFPSPLPLSG